MRHDPYPIEISLPTISDAAVVEIHNLLTEFLFLFESHYGRQIHRFYEHRSCDNLVHPDTHPRPPPDDPPF